MNEENFPLLEQPLPQLCADRLDYSLRTAVIFEEIDKKTLKSLLKSLTIKANGWVFKERKSAEKYGQLFLKMNRGYYAGPASAIMFRTIGDLVSYALRKRYLEIEDLYTTDETVLKKLQIKSKNDLKLKTLIDRIDNPKVVLISPNNSEVQIFCKSRIVDPLLLEKNRVYRLSEVEKGWYKIVKEELQPKRYFLKFID